MLRTPRPPPVKQRCARCRMEATAASHLHHEDAVRKTLTLALWLAAGAFAPLAAQSAAQGSQPQPAPKKAVMPADSLQIGRRFSEWLYTAQFDSLLAHAPADQRQNAAASRAQYEQTLVELTARAGVETEVISEKFVRRLGKPQYWRTAKFSGMSEPILVRWVIGPNGEALGLGLGPASEAPPTDPLPWP